MRRHATPELLDDDLGTPAQIAASLADLRHINSCFGGARTSIALLRRVAQAIPVKQLSLLEIGSGGGDVPYAAQRKLAHEGIALDVTLLDRRLSHLPSNSGRSVVADAMQLPFADGSFDIVGSNLFLHHFGPEPLQNLCRESLRVARRAVVINDLIRSPIHLVLVYLGLPLFGSRLTWNDAPASVRAAYTIDEMKSLFASLRGCRVDVSRHFLYRMGVILWK